MTTNSSISVNPPRRGSRLKPRMPVASDRERLKADARVLVAQEAATVCGPEKLNPL
jgi:hypothetical protein